MTNISAEKLQKNIGQQTSYIDMYRSELLKESLRFNIASLLRHVALNRASFGTDDFSRLATDCLLVFLHASVFRKVAYFAPTDVENPAVGKCARNLHRLMLENVKSTMRIIDYEVLLKVASGELEEDGIQAEREKVHDEVFPQEKVMKVSIRDDINDAFFTLVDMETSKAKGFVDFDVQKTTGLETEICQKISASPRRDDKLPQSQYGIIGSSIPYLDTPFIKYSGSYYSFVTRFSLERIAPMVAEAAATVPELDMEPAPEPAAEPEEPIEEPEVSAATVEEEDDIPFDEPEDDAAEDSMFDEDDEVEKEDEQTSVPDSEVEDESSAYKETDEYEFPDEFEEETGSEESSEDIYDASEEEQDQKQPEGEPEPESEPDTIAEPETVVAEEQYTALVSPDTYDYLDETKTSDFPADPMLDEQESDYLYDDEDDESEAVSELDNEPDPYGGESLFSELDESDELEGPESEEPVEEPEEDNPDQVQSFPADEDEQEATAVEEEPEPALEPEKEPEPVSVPEPEPEPVQEKSLPLLDQILKFSPSKSNPITQYFNNCDIKQKEEIVRFIEMARKSWLIDGKDKMFTIPDTNISVAVFSETQDPMLGIQRRENIGAVMFASGKDTWNSLELSYDGTGQFAKADYVRIGRSSYTDWEWKIVEKLGTRLLERRGK